MSEKKTSEILMERIDKMETSLKTLIEAKPTAKPTEHHEEPKHNHFTADLAYLEQADACPECKKGLKDFGKEYMRKTLEERSKLPNVCTDCGMGVKPEEPKCFNCGGEDYEER